MLSKATVVAVSFLLHQILLSFGQVRELFTLPPGEPPSPCLPHCFNNGTCIENDDGDGSCVCPPNFYGFRCAFSVNQSNPCKYKHCSNGTQTHCFPCNKERTQKCIPNELDHKNYSCHCKDNFQGEYCHISMLEARCNWQTCNGQGEGSIDDSGRCKCSCYVGFEGERCERNNSCVEHANDCLNGGTCVPSNESPGFRCSCSKFYESSNCATLKKGFKNPCDRSPCSKDGTSASYIAEVADKPDGRCFCECKEEYFGDTCKQAVSKVDPCKMVEQPQQSDDEYFIEGDGKPCTKHGKCEPDYSDKKAPKAKCNCDYGWVGQDCGIRDACVSGTEKNKKSPCAKDQICITEPNEIDRELPGTYRCYCPNVGDGMDCDQPPKECENLCQNGGTCVVCGVHAACREDDDIYSAKERNVTCLCLPEFEGANCETRKALPCDALPCQNGGTCENITQVFENGTNYRCICAEGYSGEDCQLISDACKALNPCYNGECILRENKTAEEEEEDYHCECSSQWHGSLCDIPDEEGVGGLTDLEWWAVECTLLAIVLELGLAAYVVYRKSKSSKTKRRRANAA